MGTDRIQFVDLQYIYDRIIFYKDMRSDKFLLDEYMLSVLGDGTIISFVTPKGISIVQKDSDGQLFTTPLKFDEAIDILKLHLRKKKIEKLQDDKNKNHRTS